MATYKVIQDVEAEGKNPTIIIDVPALQAYYEGMQKNHPIQYTIRGVQPAVDAEIRRMARASQRSLNEVVLDVLSVGTAVPVKIEPDTSLDDLFGTMTKDDAEELERASRECRTVHPKEYL